jgi:hypothetical protein
MVPISAELEEIGFGGGGNAGSGGSHREDALQFLEDVLADTRTMDFQDTPEV